MRFRPSAHWPTNWKSLICNTAARGYKIDGLEAASVFKKSKKKIRRSGGESSTCSAFEAD